MTVSEREVHSLLTTLLSQFMEVVDSLETEGMTVTELLKVRLVPHCPKRSSDGHQLDHFNCSFVAPVSQWQYTSLSKLQEITNV